MAFSVAVEWFIRSRRSDEHQKRRQQQKAVQARGAPVIAVTDGESDAAEVADETLMIPETTERAALVLANFQLQLFSYHLADALGRPIDKPRNLAKSVTVE